MYGPPTLEAEHLDVSTASLYGIDVKVFFGLGVWGDVAYPVANLGIYVPFLIQAPLLVTNLYWVNGTTITGATTVDMAVYDELASVKLFGTGGVVQAGALIPQATALATAYYLAPGRYWVGIVASNNTTQFRAAIDSASVTQSQKFLGSAEQAIGSAALPAVPTFAAATHPYLPLMGLNASALTL